MKSLFLLALSVAVVGAEATAPAAASVPPPIPAVIYILGANGAVWQWQQNQAGSWDLISMRKP